MNSSPLIIGYGSISEISEINEIRLNWINKGYIIVTVLNLNCYSRDDYEPTLIILVSFWTTQK